LKSTFEKVFADQPNKMLPKEGYTKSTLIDGRIAAVYLCINPPKNGELTHEYSTT
jgi:hypothetical protein